MKTFRLAIGGEFGIDEYVNIKVISAKSARAIVEQSLRHGWHVWYCVEI